MKLFINVIGRLLLLAAAGLILGFGIPLIISTIQALNAGHGWWNFGDDTFRNHHIVLLIQIGSCLCGLAAAFGVITGRRSAGLVMAALLLLVSPIYTIVTGVQAGTFTGTWEQIWSLIRQFAVPFMYFGGTLLLVSYK